LTTVTQLINDSFRESNLIATGASPTAAETTEALRLFNRVVQGLYGYELGDPLETIPLGTGNIDTPSDIPYFLGDLPDDHAPVNIRIACNLTQAETVYLHPVPEDGARMAVTDLSGNFNTYNLILDGNGRKIEGANSLTLSTASLTRQWFYRDDIGEWKRVSDLVGLDESPFPPEFDDLLIVGLTIRLASRYGLQPSSTSLASYTSALSKFRSRYSQVRQMPVELGLRLNAGDRWYRAWGPSMRDFNRGYMW
jgi:hypothetical protein